MMKQWRNKGWLMVLLCLPCLYGAAQSFRYQAMLDTIHQTGFYAIPILPELSVHMQTDFGDVRIWDAKEKQVPYIVRSRKPQWQISLFQPFPLIENRLDDSGRSVIVVRKNIPAPISGLSLILKNASVSRYAALSGSNDGKKWFIISEQLLINDSYETGTDSSIQAVSFPPSAYPYYRLVINNHKSDPLNIVSIGYYPPLDYKNVDPYVKNGVPQFRQTDSSNGTSYIVIHQRQEFPVDKIRIVIDKPPFFSRRFTITDRDRSTNESRSLYKTISSSSVLNDSIIEELMPAVLKKDFSIEIANGDNPPLQVRSVETWQIYHELIAYLEAGKRYKLLMDAANATAPHYDLQQFSDSIPAVVPSIVVKEITPVNNLTVTADFKPFPRLFIWLIMLGIVALLGLLTWRLTAEMRKNV